MKTTFMSLKNRNKEYAKIPKSERQHYRKRSFRNQLLHPMYVDDYTQETGIALSSQDKGFGNNIYRTYFKAIYVIERKA